MLLESIILYCFDRLHAERSSNATYHILTGKRSIQTIQDVHLYNIQRFYGIYKSLSKRKYNSTISKLYMDGFLIEESNAYILSPSGIAWLNSNRLKHGLHYFNGIQFEEISALFMDRLLLLIQVMTNYKKNNNTYIPIIDKQAIGQWVKTYFKRVKHQNNVLVNHLYVELYRILDCFTAKEAKIIVDRFTGYNHYGKSLEQIALEQKATVQHIFLFHERTVHRMLHMITKDKDQYPLLFSMIKDLIVVNKLTQSARQTYHYLMQQFKPHEIAHLRKITVNTVHDHIVEIAVHNKHFSITSYVNEQEQQEVIQAVQKNKSFKLKTLKNQVSNDMTYFQIRLVLAMLTHVQGGEMYGTDRELGDDVKATF